MVWKKLLSFYEAFDIFHLRVVAWFIRLAWLPFLLWGCIDLLILLTQPLTPEQAEGKMDGAAIRITGGLVLFLIWLFMVRTRGRWTMNKDGRLER